MITELCPKTMSVTSYLLLLFFLALNLPQLLLVSVDSVTATTRRPHKLSF